MELFSKTVNPLSANPKTWSNTLKQFVGNSPTNCLSVLGHFVRLAFKGLRFIQKMSNVKSPTIIDEAFKINETIRYCLRMRNKLYARHIKTVRYGTETISILFSKMWSLISQNIKDSSSLTYFKKSFRKWKPNCPCRLCKTFLQHVGFTHLNSSFPLWVF